MYHTHLKVKINSIWQGSVCHLVLYNKIVRNLPSMDVRMLLLLLAWLLLPASEKAAAQTGNDTIRVGAVEYNGKVMPMILLEEYNVIAKIADPAERERINKLRNEVYATYSYALAAAVILKDVNANLDNAQDRRSRKIYLKTIDKKLDQTFKEALKNMSIDQGHVLIKLIDRQTGQNCYSIIKELKGGFSAVVWQSVGVFFNNNLARDYDPNDRDKDIENIVKELEASNSYRYQLYEQEALLKKVTKP